LYVSRHLSRACAILKNPSVLILGEVTSAVDNETEAAIQRSLDAVIRNRTTIVIAHRLSTVRQAECIHSVEVKSGCSPLQGLPPKSSHASVFFH
jgi:ATP-binding cassette subfamily B protein